MMESVDRFSTLIDLFEQSSNSFGGNFAVTMGEKHLTYRELNTYAKRVAGFLQEVGAPVGVSIAIVSENCTEWCIAFWSIIYTGARVVAVDPFLQAEKIKFVLKDSNTQYVFASSLFYDLIKEFKIKSIKKIIDLSKIYTIDGKFIPVHTSPEDDAILIYTSGTMGSQKGVILSHKNIISDIFSAFNQLPYKPKTSFLSLLPFSHMFGITVGFIGPLYNGGRVVLPKSFKGYEIQEAIKNTSPQVGVVVPLILKMFMNTIKGRIKDSNKLVRGLFLLNFSLAKIFNKVGLRMGKILFRRVHKTFGGKLNYFISGGAHLDEEIEEFFDTIGIPVLSGYGLTEASPVVAVNSLKERKPKSVGRALPGVEVKLTEDGEFIIKGPNITKGYYKNKDATKAVIKDGWFYTGDIGEIDKDGFIFIRGRKKNVIVTEGGLKIFPEELEKLFMRSPYIKEICVLGREIGEVEEVYAVIYPDYSLIKGLSTEEIYAKIKEEIDNLQKDIAPYKKLSVFEIWEKELPKTTTKKFKRNLIKELIKESEEERKHPVQAEEMDALSNKIRGIVSKLANVNISEIIWESNLYANLGIDSLMKIEILSAIDKEFDVYIPDEISYQIETFKDLVEKVKEYMGAPGKIQETFLFTNTKGNINEIIKDNLIYRFTRAFVTMGIGILMRAYFRLRIKNRDKIPSDGAFIIAPNHTSLLDFPAIYTALPVSKMQEVAAPAAKDYFFKNPVISFLVQASFKAFPLERYGNFFEGLNVCAKVLSLDKPLVLFPEGTRSIKGTLQPFKPGIGLLSCELNIPIVPIYIKGAFQAFPKGGRFPKPEPIEVRFGNPIYPEEYNRLKGRLKNYEIYQKIIEELRTRIIDLMKENGA